MRINYAMWSMNRAGGTRAIFEVANRLSDRGHTVTFTSVGKDGSHKWFPLKANVHYVTTPFLLRAFRKTVIRRYYREWEYCLEKALANSIPDCDVNVATFCYTVRPVISSGKGIPFHYVQHYEPLFFDNKIQSAIAKVSYFYPTKKLVVSNWLGKLVYRLTGVQPILVGNGVNTETFYPRVSKLFHSGKEVLSIFRGIRWKGEEDVIDAMNILSKKLAGTRLVAIGTESVFNEITKGKKIEFDVNLVEPPSDSTLAELYSSVDLFVFASWSEGFGLPPLEAMACGTPVVSTFCQGVKDYAVDGSNALLVPPRNPAKLAETMLKALTDENLSAKMRKNGIQTAKENDWDKVVDRVENGFKIALYLVKEPDQIDVLKKCLF